MGLSTAIAIVGCIVAVVGSIIGVSTFVLSRKDKSNSDIATEQYKFGKLDEQLKNIFRKLDKIDAKLDVFDKEVEDKINLAIQHHIAVYHKGELK